MGNFFKSTSFKILAAIFIVLLAFMLRATLTGGASVMATQIAGSITKPFSQVGAAVSNGVTVFFDSFVSKDTVQSENEKLKLELRDINKKLVDYEQMKHENEYLKKFLGVKEQNPDFKFETAEVIARDPNNRFHSFMIDKGSLAGICYLDPVITADGLVGRVSEVGLTYSKVTTIIDVSLDVGSYNVRTRDTGVLGGDTVLADQGYCKLSLLPRESVSTKGDRILTTGIGGLFPQDLMIGKIVRVENEADGKSMFAVVDPAADIETVTDVMVITEFLGQDSAANEIKK